ncbi:MAG: FecR family protein [Opitutaceae bacterium]
MNTFPKAIDEAASRWLSRHEAGLSSTQEAEFQHWLHCDIRHAGAYRSLERSWRRLDQVVHSRFAAKLEAELNILPPLPTDTLVPFSPRRRGFWRPWISPALAASLALGIGYFAWWRPMQTVAPFAETAATPVGMIRKMDLPDGSIVRLNTDTAIEVIFTKTKRRIRLCRGEALFTIAKNASRPFVVNAAGVDVRALGTEFNVRLRSESVEVTVTEGEVRVDAASNDTSLLARSTAGARPASKPTLSAGHRVVIPVAVPQAIPRPVAPTVVPPVEIQRALAWQDRRLVFESAPLSEIVAEFNRYNRHQLVIADSELGTRQFGGTFDANDPKTMIELLRTTYGVLVEHRDGMTLLRAAP